MRIIWIYLNLIFWTLLFGLSSFFTILLTGKKENFKFFGLIWGKTLSFIFNIKLVIKGKHNLQNRNYIFASNHASLIDIPLLLIAVNRYTVFIAKSELSKIPIFKSILDRAGFIFVDRKNNDSAVKSMNNLMDDIKKIPRSVAIFPEGTRTSDGELLPFKKGAAIFAIVPISMGTLGFIATGLDMKVPAGLVNYEVIKELLPVWAVYPFLFAVMCGLLSTCDSAMCAVSSLAS